MVDYGVKLESAIVDNHIYWAYRYHLSITRILPLVLTNLEYDNVVHAKKSFIKKRSKTSFDKIQNWGNYKKNYF